jgi:hypothetical protein
MVVLNPTDGETIDVTFTMLELDAAVPNPATAAEIELVDGFYLTVGQDTVELLFGDVSMLSGVAVPPDAFPTRNDGLPGAPIAMWYLDPFDAESEGGMPVRIRNDFGLAEGTVVEVWSAVYDDYAWHLAGTLTVTGADLVGDAKLPVLSATVLVEAS